MAHIKCYSLCKVLAIVLSVLIAGQAHFAVAGAGQEETPGAAFNAAKAAYLSGGYEAARDGLAKLAEETAETEENRVFLGNVYLLLAASEEKLGDAEPARKHYLKAKELLGEGKAVVEGVSFVGLGVYGQVFAVQDDSLALRSSFERAKRLYFDEDYEGAKLELEKLMNALAPLQGWEVLKGHTFLLLGASYEKLKYKELAVKYYCRAKEILGAGKTFEGLDLKKLKYYKEACGAVAARTARRGGSSFLGRALGTLLTLAALGGLVWWLFFSKNAPLKATGEYTSVTVQVDVTYKGMNSKGTRTLAFDGVEQLNEDFLYTQPAEPCDPDNPPDCDNATQSESHSFLVETDGKSLEMIQRYINWDYYSRSAPACKVLCADWTFTVVGYKYESGKKDPGSPNIEGIENLELDRSDCDPDLIDNPTEVHTCTTQATLTFQAPGAGAKVKKTFTAHQTLKHSN